MTLKMMTTLAALGLTSSLALANEPAMKAPAAAAPAAKAAPKPEVKTAPPPAAAPAPAAAAEKPPAMELPKPGPQQQALKAMAGNWRCESTWTGMDNIPGKGKSSWNNKLALNDMWLTTVYKRAKTKAMPAFEGHATVGWNSVTKKFTLTGFDTWGGWLNLSAADGLSWTGEGTMHGAKMPVKWTFTRNGDKEISSVFEMGGHKGFEETCKK